MLPELCIVMSVYMWKEGLTLVSPYLKTQWVFVWLVLETRSHYPALAGLELTMETRLSVAVAVALPPQYWDYNVCNST